MYNSKGYTYKDLDISYLENDMDNGWCGIIFVFYPFVPLPITFRLKNKALPFKLTPLHTLFLHFKLHNTCVKKIHIHTSRVLLYLVN